MAARGIVHGPLGPETAHLCVDMQRLFAPGGPWAVPWMEKVLPKVAALAEARPEATVFTRFIPADRPGGGTGAWARYWNRWAEVTLERLDPGLLRLVPELERLAPPARVLDKRVYSPWTEGHLAPLLAETAAGALVVTGGETDLCVLASVLGAVDLGFRVILVEDALCSSSDRTHDALMRLYRERFGAQIEVAETEEVLEAWK